MARLKHSLSLAFIFCLILFSGKGEEKAEHLYEIGVMGSYFTFPHYRGSDEQEHKVLPLPYFVYRGEFFQSKDGKFNLGKESKRWSYGLSFFGNPSFEESEARQGMRDLGSIIEIGPALTYTWKERVQSEYYHSIRARTTTAIDSGDLRYAGLQYEALTGMKYYLDQNKNIKLQTNIRVLYGDEKRHKYFYEVLPSESRANRPAYSVGSGFSGWSYDLAYVRRLNKRQTFVSFFRVDSVSAAEFEDSPLVKQDTNFSFGLIYVYKFKLSNKMVTR